MSTENRIFLLKSNTTQIYVVKNYNTKQVKHMENSAKYTRKRPAKRRSSQKLYAFPAHINFELCFEKIVKVEGLGKQGKAGAIRLLLIEALEARGMKRLLDEEGLLYPDVSGLKKMASLK